MKKISLLAVAAMAALAIGCNSNKEGNDANANTPTTSDSLRVALANQDSLLMLMNDVAEGMAQIKQMGNILGSTTGSSPEAVNKRQQIRDDILAIQRDLQQRRERLAELEKKLNEAGNTNTTLKRTIETLKAQIADQEGTIASLRNELAAANVRIDELTSSVDSLNTTVASVSEERAAAQERAAALNAELNTCYYIIGTNKELKDKKVIESGFLRKTKVIPGQVETSLFIRADKTQLTAIPLHSKKAKVMTAQPANSYQIVEDANGAKTLRITNPGLFWEKSNFLVVKID